MIKKLWESILLSIGTWCYSKLFTYIDICADPNNKDEGLIGVTFTDSESYLAKIQEIKL